MSKLISLSQSRDFPSFADGLFHRYQFPASRGWLSLAVEDTVVEYPAPHLSVTALKTTFTKKKRREKGSDLLVDGPCRLWDSLLPT